MQTNWNLENIYSDKDVINRDITLLKEKIEKNIEKIKLNKQNRLAQEDILEIIKNYEEIIELYRKLQAYVICTLSTDSKNEEAQKTKGILNNLSSLLILLNLELEELIYLNKPSIENYQYFIEKTIENFSHRMKNEEEHLYSKIYISSTLEWKSLYNELISNIKVDFEDKVISISQLRNLYNHPIREIRKKAYEKELEIFKEYEYIFAKILNSLKWDAIVINEKRNFKNVLEKSLFDNQIDKEILDLVINTTFENLSTVRRYFYKKAKLLQIDKLQWYDLSVGIFGDKAEKFDINKTKNFILENFRSFSTELEELARKAFENNWIDWEPKLGKVDGGFCIYVYKDESRILVNYDNSIKSLLTLAHELGHAYHNYVMSENSPIYRHSPMILAEMASILAETIVRNKTIENTKDKHLKAHIFDGYLFTISVVVIDILSRFIFEDKLINIRKERILTPSELCKIMIDSQKEVYLDSIASYHPYMWANKPHYYSSNYYNYPYLVGLLIGLALYNLYKNKKITAKDYRDLLRNSAKDKPYKVLKSVGLDMKEKDFWQESFNLIKYDIEEFEKL